MSRAHSARQYAKSAAQKIGLKPGPWLAVGAPAHYRSLLGDLPPGAVLETAPPGARPAHHYDLIHVFVGSVNALATALDTLAPGLAPGGALWVSWPKKGSALFVDLTEDAIREQALACDLVDVKVCAIDADWSGLKLVRRKRPER